MKKLLLYSIPRSVKQYKEGNKIIEQHCSDYICFVNSGAAGKPEDLIQVKHRDTGMVIAPGDDDYDSDEELRPELEDGKICFLLLLPPDMNEALFWKSQTHSANDDIYDFD